MKPHRTRFLSLTAAAVTAAMVLAACSSNSSSGSGSSGNGSKPPIVIGTSLSLTGDFSADGQAFQRGYELWASQVNSHGGLLGRQVKMVFLNDSSDPTTVATNYTKLIAQQHVSLVFGPFSTLLTVPAAKVAARYGYAFPEGAGGGPAVYQLNLPNVFNPSPPIAQQLVPFADWVAALPASERPKTAAYPMVNDPFADPMAQTAESILQKAGVKTVYSKIYPAENPDFKAGADAVAATGAQLVVLGAVNVPTSAAFIQAFEQQHYNPKIFVATSGPDQGSAFTKAIGGAANATGIMVPGGWYGGVQNPLSQADGQGVHRQVRRYRRGHQRGRGRGLLGRRDHGVLGHRDQGRGQQEDHRLPAQRRHAADRAGAGEIQQLGREHGRAEVHLPVAEGRQLRPGAAERRDRLGGDRQSQAALVELSTSG